MKLFKCQSCGQLLYFENTNCERCSHRLGYLPQAFTVSAVEPAGERWKALANPERPFRFCDNAGYDACNWLIEADVAGGLPPQPHNPRSLGCRQRGPVATTRAQQA